MRMLSPHLCIFTGLAFLNLSRLSAEPLSTADADVATWRLVVLDGKSSVLETRPPRSIAEATTPAEGDIPGTEPHIWAPAAWGLQLGATPAPFVVRTYFGPNEGMPVPGDFNGDGFDELAVFIDGEWHLDFNGDNAWNAADLWVKSGAKGDRPIVGDWNQDGKTDIGVFTATATGLRSPTKRLLGLVTGESEDAAGHRPGTSSIIICTERGCVCRQRITNEYRFGSTSDIPVVGDWNRSGEAAIGTFRDGLWKLDLDGDGRFSDLDLTLRLGEPGDLPIVGDFNRDGIDELGIYRRGLWHIDTSGDRRLGDNDLTLKLGDENDVPVVGDWDGHGRDQIGIIAKGRPRTLDSL